jgi:hypothetical protein
VEAAFEATSDGGASSPLVPSRLHDFGFRGCTSVEQSVIGGCAHLLSFTGSDTMSAAYYAQVCAYVRAEQFVVLAKKAVYSEHNKCVPDCDSQKGVS